MNIRPHQPRSRRVPFRLAVAGLALLSVACLGDAGSARATSRHRPFRPTPAPKHTGVVMGMRWGIEEDEDPTAMVVDGAEAFVVDPNSVADHDPADGHLRWKTDVKDAEPGVAVDGETVLVAAVDGFEALDRPTGHSRWRVEIADPYDRGRIVGLVPTPSGPVAVTVTDRGVVTGLDAQSGIPRWSRTLDGTPQGEVVADPARSGAVVVMNRGDHVDLVVLDAATGAPRWVRPLEAATGLPVVDGDQLVIGTGAVLGAGVVRSYDLVTSAPDWETPVEASSEPDQGPVVDGPRILNVSNAGYLTALDRRTGAKRWTRRLPDIVFHGRPVVFGDVVIVGSMASELFTVDRTTGRPRARMIMTGAPVALGAGVGGLVYARGDVHRHQLVGLPAEIATHRTNWTGSYESWTPQRMRDSLREWRRTHGPTLEPERS